MYWNVIDSGKQSAKKNMELDEELLNDLDQHDRPILHFYDWEKPSATYGLLTNPEEFLSVKAAGDLGIELAKRPTGGGIIFHVWDYAFSVLVPSTSEFFSENTLENYAFVNNAVLQAVTPFFETKDSLELIPNDAPSRDRYCERFCMAKPTRYDVVYKDRKIAGAAQRKTKKGFLHQGSIAISMPDPEILKKILHNESLVLEAMLHYSYPILGDKMGTDMQIQAVRLQLKDQLYKYITKEKDELPIKNCHYSNAK